MFVAEATSGLKLGVVLENINWFLLLAISCLNLAMRGRKMVEIFLPKDFMAMPMTLLEIIQFLVGINLIVNSLNVIIYFLFNIFGTVQAP